MSSACGQHPRPLRPLRTVEVLVLSSDVISPLGFLSQFSTLNPVGLLIMVVKDTDFRVTNLDLNPNSATYYLCDFEQVVLL
jgi:hypothetical protein